MIPSKVVIMKLLHLHEIIVLDFVVTFSFFVLLIYFKSIFFKKSYTMWDYIYKILIFLLISFILEFFFKDALIMYVLPIFKKYIDLSFPSGNMYDGILIKHAVVVPTPSIWEHLNPLICGHRPSNGDLYFSPISHEVQTFDGAVFNYELFIVNIDPHGLWNLRDKREFPSLRDLTVREAKWYCQHEGLLIKSLLERNMVPDRYRIQANRSIENFTTLSLYFYRFEYGEKR